MARSLALLCLSLLTASPLPCAEGEAAASQQATVPEGHCPVLTDELVDPTVTAEWNGRTVAFCCKMCRKQFLTDPEAFAAHLPPLPPTAAPAEAVVDGPALPPTPRADNRPESWSAWLGRLHPVIVHFPIALLVLAGATELLARPGNTRARARSRALLSLGAPLAAVAAGMGWLAARESGFPTLADVLERHRWLGIATAVVSLLALALAPRDELPVRWRARAYRWLLLASVALVILTGHHGATLVHGPGWLSLPR